MSSHASDPVRPSAFSLFDNGIVDRLSGIIRSGKRLRHTLFGAAVLFLLLALPAQPAAAAVEFDPALYNTGLITSPGDDSDYFDTDPIPVTWENTSATKVTLLTALSPTFFPTIPLEDQPAYLAGLTWRVIEEGLPNTGSYTLPAGSLEPSNDHLLLLVTGRGEWDVTDGEVGISITQPDFSCDDPGVPQPGATMSITGGTWGGAAQWVDLLDDPDDAIPPRTLTGVTATGASYAFLQLGYPDNVLSKAESGWKLVAKRMRTIESDETEKTRTLLRRFGYSDELMAVLQQSERDRLPPLVRERLKAIERDADEKTQAGLHAARARGRLGGRPKSLTPKKAQMAEALYKDKNNTIDEICKTLNVSRATFYRYVKAK